METAIVTLHAYKRFKKRVGLSRKAAQKMADRALRFGKKHSDTTGSLRRYCDGLFLKHKKGNALRIYGEHIYIFHNNNLITILYLPMKMQGHFKGAAA